MTGTIYYNEYQSQSKWVESKSSDEQWLYFLF
jgi:hypothetical protein